MKRGLLKKMADQVRSFWVSGEAPPGLGGNSAGGGASYAGEMVSERTALQLSTVWSCVNLLAGTVASLPVMVYRADAQGQRSDAKDHPLYALLHDSPNADQTALDFWEFVQASLELWGNAYARKQFGSRDQLIGLVPIMPNSMSVRRLTTGVIEYRWVEEGRQFRGTEADVFHIRGFGGNPLGGLSALSYGRESLGRARAIQRTSGEMFRNGLRASGAFKFAEFLSPEEREIAEREMVERYAGSANAGKPMLLEGGADFVNLSIKPDDAEMLATENMTVEDLCRWFGVLPYMIGHGGSDHMGTGLEQQVIAFEKFTLRRRLARNEQAIRKQLLTDADRARGVTVEFSLDGLLRGDAVARHAAYKAGLDGGYYTINQVRRFENLPPIDGGDVPRLQMQYVPLSTADAVAAGKTTGAGQ